MNPMRAALVGIYRGIVLKRKLRGPAFPSWSPEFETLATLMHNYSKVSTLLPLAVQRQAATSLLRPTKATSATQYEPERVGSIRCEWFRKATSSRDRVFLYLHGGGYSIGSIDTHRDLVARIVAASGMQAFVPDYRLAPEHRFPAQLEDALECYRWLLKQGFMGSQIVVGGDSAGGGLTLSLLLALRDAGDPLPAAAVVLSPWADLEATGGSMRSNAPYDYVGRATLLTYASRFVTAKDRKNPLAAPLYGDYRGLPPILIQVGAVETLLDDAIRVTSRARRAGVDVRLEIEPEMIHVWQAFGNLSSNAEHAVARIGEYARQAVGLGPAETKAAATYG
ncbi:MAG: alpha/beta hydrolase [Polyangiaceae bacterium]|nr:alpha/beta hydrolase [Polyangiaceae bacterium]MCB9609083.1 alpha/beta hydrolase [Polyangiaceae bacterium]